MNCKPKETTHPRLSGNLVKVCALCGKAEDKHWAHHWKIWHKIQDKEKILALCEGKDPDEPWCSNWRDVIDHRVLPKDILLQYQKFYRHGGKSMASSMR